VARLPLAFEGAGSLNTPKGKDAAERDTKTAIFARPLLKVDISRLVGRKARVLEAAVGFEYWYNMFGKNADRVPGADQMTPVFALAVHLPMGDPGTDGRGGRCEADGVLHVGRRLGGERGTGGRAAAGPGAHCRTEPAMGRPGDGRAPGHDVRAVRDGVARRGHQGQLPGLPPPSYGKEGARRYPVVYWLHSGFGNARQGAWAVEHRDRGIRAGLAPEVIVILAQGLPVGWYVNSKDGRRPVEDRPGA
jgi:hypothetical protein